MKTDNEKAKAVRDYAAQCNGSEQFYRHGLARRLLYTDGVKFLAETCGAFWLVDAIASYVATSKAVNAEDFQVWELEAFSVAANAVRLVCTNGNDEIPIVSQIIELTDFPRELLPFKLWCEKGEQWTLMLPEER